MNHRMRRTVETLACERRYGIADAKGAEYSGAGKTYKETEADTLNNFKSVAERIGGTPEQVLMTYLLKHVDSINTTVREAAVFYRDPDISDPTSIYAAGEGIVSRLDDARNYLDLLECLLIDNGHIDYPDNCDPESVAVADGVDWDQHFGPEGFVLGPPEIKTERRTAYDAESDRMLKEAGLTEGLDGVWRGATKVDESVPPNALKETPICGPPPVHVQPTMDQVRDSLETGEI